MGDAIFIYSRKSKWTGRGESVENQIQMCRDYIARNLADAKDSPVFVFEDEGYSGKNTKRPQFQQMMKEIRRGACRYLVCYKLDRLGRNLIDLAALVEELNRLEVSFISIRESFDTTTPLGKTMLYMAGIFAQMEREQIAERVRDNMVMLAKSGRWLGGNTPLGFSSRQVRSVKMDDKVRTSFVLKENPEELLTVRFLFQEFQEKQSFRKIEGYLWKNGILTRRGKEYTSTAIRDILTNPVYCAADGDAYDYFLELGCQVCFTREEADGSCGLMAYARTSSARYKNKENPPSQWIIAQGKHKGEIPGKEFVRVQRMIGANKRNGEAYQRMRNEVALLPGIVMCSCGHAMRPKYYKKGREAENIPRSFYYLCTCKDSTHGERCTIPNVPGNELDLKVCQALFKAAVPARRGKEKEGWHEKTEEDRSTADRRKFLEQALKEKDKKLEGLVELLEAAELSQELVRCTNAKAKKLEREKEGLKKQLQALEDNGKEKNTEFAQDTGADFFTLFQRLPVPRKREVLKKLLDRVEWDGKTAKIWLWGSEGEEETKEEIEGH